MERALGLLWLLDGALQFQPSMFRPAFFNDMLGMANMGLPGPLPSFIYHVTSMLTAHPVAWNAAFAVLQVAIGLGMLWDRSAWLARPVSIAWALGVWLVGEGLGGLFMPGISALNGAPGAAVLYALAALMLWPRRAGGGETAGRGETAGGGAAAGGGDVAGGPVAAADSGLLGPRGARWCWAALWSGLALLELGGANHAAVVPAAEITDIGNGEPAWLATLNHHAGQLLTGRGAAFALAVGIAQVLIGLGVLHPRWRRAALGAGIALALCYGVFGQDFGGLLTGQSTDPGTGPLLVLLALALWPRRRLTTPGHDNPPGG